MPDDRPAMASDLMLLLQAVEALATEVRELRQHGSDDARLLQFVSRAYPSVYGEAVWHLQRERED